MMSRRLRRGQLWSRVTRTTERALRSGALQPIPTEFTYLEQDGVRFLVRVVHNLARKRTLGEASREPRNPFRPPDAELLVDDVSPTHYCVLNKFNVVEHHLLIVTREFEHQESLLTEADFAALWSCMAEYEGLGFYNAGTVAGASQPHKHLQLVPLPFTPGGPPTPIEPLIEAAPLHGRPAPVPGLPFPHLVERYEDHAGREAQLDAARTYATYIKMLRALGNLPPNCIPAGFRPAPYNLLVSRRWIMLVPRARERFGSISINALGFAGALLARDEEELAHIERQGPLAVLRAAAAP
jgi:ATP adenylyltransferase